MTRTSGSGRRRLVARAIVSSVLIEAAAGALLPAGIAAATTSGSETLPEAVWPLDPHPVIAGFDPPDCRYCSGHRGVDLGGLPLHPVRAAIGGQVTYAGVLAGRGVLVIDDGGRRVTYEPVTPTVTKGEVVAPGDVVGGLDLVGSHCFPEACLHLGLIDDADDEYLDPLTLFTTPSPVRLLPFLEDPPTTILGSVTSWFL